MRRRVNDRRDGVKGARCRAVKSSRVWDGRKVSVLHCTSTSRCYVPNEMQMTALVWLRSRTEAP